MLYFCKSWVIYESKCIISAFIMFAYGCIGTNFMVIISILRLYVVSKPMGAVNITFKKISVLIFLAVIFGIFWPIMPLIGWSSYTININWMMCTIDTETKDSNHISFNVIMFLFIYIIPLVLIFYSNSKMVYQVLIKIPIKVLYFKC